MSRKLLKTVRTVTIFGSLLADTLGTRRRLLLIRGPQFENRCFKRLRLSIKRSLTRFE